MRGERRDDAAPPPFPLPAKPAQRAGALNRERVQRSWLLRLVCGRADARMAVYQLLFIGL